MSVSAMWTPIDFLVEGESVDLAMGCLRALAVEQKKQGFKWPHNIPRLLLSVPLSENLAGSLGEVLSRFSLFLLLSGVFATFPCYLDAITSAIMKSSK